MGSQRAYLVVDDRWYTPIYRYKPYLSDDLVGPVVGTTGQGNVVARGAPVRAIKGISPDLAVAVWSDATATQTFAGEDGRLIRVPLGGWVPCYRFNTTQLTATPLPSRPAWATRSAILRFVPTATPHPSIGARFNPTAFYHLAVAKALVVKGAVRGRLIQDQALQDRLVASLDAEIPVEHLPADQVAPDDLATILILVGDDAGSVLRYHPDTDRVYVLEDRIAFVPPASFVAVLTSVAQPPRP